jgi:hypothetical protein
LVLSGARVRARATVIAREAVAFESDAGGAGQATLRGGAFFNSAGAEPGLPKGVRIKGQVQAPSLRLGDMAHRLLLRRARAASSPASQLLPNNWKGAGQTA